MKILFAGPSLTGDLADLVARHPALVIAGPVARGDVVHAVRRGATAIGIVDGLFADVAPVWHKEILYALSLGVRVAGGASMGALRAAECGLFGMVGIGDVYRLIAHGIELDDGCVAQVHGPALLGHAPLSEAQVTVDATIAALLRSGKIGVEETERLRMANRAVFFADRTLEKVAEAAFPAEPERGRIRDLLIRYRDDIKRRDGLAVAAWLVSAPETRGPPPHDWQFAESVQWLAFLDELEAADLKEEPVAAR